MIKSVRIGTLVFLSMFLFLSCKKTEPIQKLPSFSIFVGKERALVSEYFEDIRYLKLSGNGTVYPSKIDQIEFLGDDIFILDKSLNMIFRFNESGDLIRVLDRRGEGPEEYQYLHRFLVDPASETIEVYDKVGRKILILNREFELLGTRNIGMFFQDFAKLGQDKFVLFLAQDNQLDGNVIQENLVLWDQGKVTPLGIPRIAADRLSLRKGIAKNSQSGLVYISQVFNDTLYMIRDQKIPEVTRTAVDFGDARLDIPEELRISLSLDELTERYRDRSYAYKIDDLFVNDAFIAFTFSYFNQGAIYGNQYFYFPQSKTGVTFNRMFNDLDGFNLFGIRQVKEKYLVYDLSPEYLSMIDPELTSEEFRKTVDFGSSLEDQMVLLFLKFKEKLPTEKFLK